MLDARRKSIKTAFFYQVFWCVALLLVSASWIYQGYISRALIALTVTTLYFVLSVTNYRLGNRLVWFCFAPVACVMFFMAYPIAMSWYALCISMFGQPFTVNIVGGLGIVSVNTAIGVVMPLLICTHLLDAVYLTVRLRNETDTPRCN